MLAIVCYAVVFTVFVSQGASLKCHYCERHSSSIECLQKLDEICSPEEDVCTIKTIWKGSLHNDVGIVKSCGVSTECPPTDQPSSSSCFKYKSGWSCTLCCNESYCNDGANGNVPRPPPYPPVPDPLIRRLTHDCGQAEDHCQTTLSWSDKFDKVQINKQCTTPEENFVNNIFKNAEKCNIPLSDPDYCVTCCTEANECVSPTESTDINSTTAAAAGSWRLQIRLTVILIMFLLGRRCSR